MGAWRGDADAGQTAALALVAPENQAELVEQDEDLETTVAKISFQMDEAELADTPWRRAGTNLSDFFNFGMSEDEFKEYVMRRGVRVRLEAKGRRKIERLEGGRRRD
ncbi:FIP1 [Symbiodinium sp. CCMP2592]|nr:FIP1 [Symbiodinium sp. CCMP2592]